MRKTILALAVLATVLTSCQPKFTINGSVSNLESNMVYLKEIKDNLPVTIDSAKVIDNKFEFTGSTDITKRCFLFENNKTKRPIAEIYIENTNLAIVLDVKKPQEIKITGGKAQLVVNKFNTIQDSLNSSIQILNNRYMALVPQKETLAEKFDIEIEKIRNDYKILIENAQEEEKTLIEANLSSVVAADKFRNISRTMKLKERKEFINKFTGEAAKCPSVIKAKETIAIIENVQIGKKAPNFTLPTPDGKTISLSSFKGNMLIVDFWASWCGPCRAENPNMVKIYNEFHEKGLEILSVSLDENKEKWTSAIEKDGLIWNHVSDLKKWNSAAAKLYGISSIPHIIVIDKNGIIVGKNLRGQELINKIRELINK